MVLTKKVIKSRNSAAKSSNTEKFLVKTRLRACLANDSGWEVGPEMKMENNCGGWVDVDCGKIRRTADVYVEDITE